MKKYLLSLWNDDAGQSTTEYILMLSVVVMIAMKFKASFADKITALVQTLSGKIDQAAGGD